MFLLFFERYYRQISSLEQFNNFIVSRHSL